MQSDAFRLAQLTQQEAEAGLGAGSKSIKLVSAELVRPYVLFP